ncbi:helix-turn-helix domain-containing protein [Streptomyces piniterrae]|uniref:Helix-turn-helix domain-containing protein n=1 Tax=Streptomyces piniterrae TaxID=2571125 RepID=A0A4U0NFT2_9ACTN|nr:helix-turn-helix transcriptional regulator [Streptomyces piniterrae]TJZ52910.1 helix-turn-helix domain-containing protein [Streptomyces piniterrae]
MTTASAPTLRQRRLGAELRKLRERAGLSSTQAGKRLGVQQARVSMIEAGRYAVGAERVRAIAREYSCTDEKLMDALAGMTGGRTRGWWDEYRDYLPADLIDIAELEHHAHGFRVALAIHIPALLQTVDHARALLREAVPAFRPYEIEHRLSYRIKRQAVLHSERPVRYSAILHEAALHMRYGGEGTARAQLKHLIEVGEQENIQVRVIPFTRGTFPGNGQSFDYLCGPAPQLDTVQLDTHHGCEFLDAEAQLGKYRSVLERMEANALKPDESRDFIRRIAKSI